jgi:F0F1-type ATP synthase membrane subunit c/vacuolar-type H+-ATPase subunit K
MLFVKAFKVLSLGVVMLPLAGCAIGTGILFASYLRSFAYNPDLEDALFGYTTLGFAFIESFAFLIFGVAVMIYAM